MLPNVLMLLGFAASGVVDVTVYDVLYTRSFAKNSGMDTTRMSESGIVRTFAGSWRIEHGTLS